MHNRGRLFLFLIVILFYFPNVVVTQTVNATYAKGLYGKRPTNLTNSELLHLLPLDDNFVYEDPSTADDVWGGTSFDLSSAGWFSDHTGLKSGTVEFPVGPGTLMGDVLDSQGSVTFELIGVTTDTFNSVKTLLEDNNGPLLTFFSNEIRGIPYTPGQFDTLTVRFAGRENLTYAIDGSQATKPLSKSFDFLEFEAGAFNGLFSIAVWNGTDDYEEFSSLFTEYGLPNQPPSMDQASPQIINDNGVLQTFEFPVSDVDNSLEQIHFELSSLMASDTDTMSPSNVTLYDSEQDQIDQLPFNISSDTAGASFPVSYDLKKSQNYTLNVVFRDFAYNFDREKTVSADFEIQVLPIANPPSIEGFSASSFSNYSFTLETKVDVLGEPADVTLSQISNNSELVTDPRLLIEGSGVELKEGDSTFNNGFVFTYDSLYTESTVVDIAMDVTDDRDQSGSGTISLTLDNYIQDNSPSSITIDEDQTVAIPFDLGSNGAIQTQEFQITDVRYDLSADPGICQPSTQFVVSPGLNTFSGNITYTPPSPLELQQVIQYDILVSDSVVNHYKEGNTMIININAINNVPPEASPQTIVTPDSEVVQLNFSSLVCRYDLDKVISHVEITKMPDIGSLTNCTSSDSYCYPFGDSVAYSPAPQGVPFRNDTIRYRVIDDAGQESNEAEITIEIESSFRVDLNRLQSEPIEENADNFTFSLPFTTAFEDRTVLIHITQQTLSLGRVYAVGNTESLSSVGTQDVSSTSDVDIVTSVNNFTFIPEPYQSGTFELVFFLMTEDEEFFSPEFTYSFDIEFVPVDPILQFTGTPLSVTEGNTLLLNNTFVISSPHGPQTQVTYNLSTETFRLRYEDPETGESKTQRATGLFTSTVEEANAFISSVEFFTTASESSENRTGVVFVSAQNPELQELISSRASVMVLDNPNSLDSGNNEVNLGAIIGGSIGGLIVLLVIVIIIVLVAICFIRRAIKIERRELPPDYERLAFGMFTPVNIRQKRFVNRKLRELEKEILDNENLIYGLLDMDEKVDEVVRNLTYITENVGRSVWMIDKLIERELELRSDPKTLFRANSSACKVMTVYTKIVGLEYLHNTIGQNIKDIMADVNANVEVNPHKLDEEEDADANRWTLMAVTQRLLNNVLRSVPDCPEQFRVICRSLYEGCVSRPSFDQHGYIAIGSFFFLRFIGPAVATPHIYGLLPTAEPGEDRRKLVSLSKVIMNLANNVHFGQKETGFEALNEFIDKNIPEINKFYDNIRDVDTDPLSLPAIRLPKGLRERALYDLYSIIKDNSQVLQDALQKIDASDANVQRAIDVVQSLCQPQSNSNADNVEMVETIDV